MIAIASNRSCKQASLIETAAGAVNYENRRPLAPAYILNWSVPSRREGAFFLNC